MKLALGCVKSCSATRGCHEVRFMQLRIPFIALLSVTISPLYSSITHSPIQRVGGCRRQHDKRCASCSCMWLNTYDVLKMLFGQYYYLSQMEFSRFYYCWLRVWEPFWSECGHCMWLVPSRRREGLGGCRRIMWLTTLSFGSDDILHDAHARQRRDGGRGRKLLPE